MQAIPQADDPPMPKVIAVGIRSGHTVYERMYNGSTLREICTLIGEIQSLLGSERDVNAVYRPGMFVTEDSVRTLVGLAEDAAAVLNNGNKPQKRGRGAEGYEEDVEAT